MNTRRVVGWLAIGTLAAGTAAAALGLATDDAGESGQHSADAPSSTTSSTTTTSTWVPADTLSPVVQPGAPWGSEVAGILTFRGNPTRTFYGTGPVPRDPEVLWRFPRTGGMCAESSVGGESKVWCGTGWTGQPSVFQRDGRTWVAFGAYDRNVHLLDGATGDRIIADFPTGDIIKGSVTIDPDGFPLLYTGSRDNNFRVIAIDRDPPEELWSLSASSVGPTLWNDDWDGSALVLDDYLLEGGENSRFHVARLNRGYDEAGRVTVAPELVFHVAGWDDELLAEVGRAVSIENSVSAYGDTVYFANGGGLVQGWDLGPLRRGDGEPSRVFRYWVGDDVDASVVVDERGMLYVGVEYERANQRSRDVGQIVKLDPSEPEDPLVWSVPDHDAVDGGIWATPAIYGDMVYASTNGGRLLGIDRASGDVVWTKRLPGPLWQSPVVVDDVLIQGDCEGFLHAFDVSDPAVEPPEIWSVELGGCIESTPAVWNGRIYVGTRAGAVHAIADRKP